ncbi:hypothetical protein [Intrasporangium sp. DVR]|uniref:hypothetical protein n=1 Tax=Intrasporangium sp. DVR TaxID=3127867 RepID=UPI00313A5137
MNTSLTQQLLDGYTAYASPMDIQRESLADTDLASVGTSISLSVSVSYSLSVSWSWSWT